MEIRELVTSKVAPWSLTQLNSFKPIFFWQLKCNASVQNVHEGISFPTQFPTYVQVASQMPAADSVTAYAICNIQGKSNYQFSIDWQAENSSLWSQTSFHHFTRKWVASFHISKHLSFTSETFYRWFMEIFVNKSPNTRKWQWPRYFLTIFTQ